MDTRPLAARPRDARLAIRVTTDRARAIGTSWLSVGATHVDSSLEPGFDPEAVSGAKTLLADTTVHQNQHIIGWGAENPWPDPAHPAPTNWATLDRRIALINDTGGLPVITLASAPWWMKGIARSEEWETIAYERRVRDDYLDHWVALCRAVAERYTGAPYFVRYFQVWNEMKGYYNPSTNNWDAGINPDFGHGYTHMYNLIYDALKAVNPFVQVGGPYVVMDSFSDRGAMSHPSRISGPYGTLDQRALDVVSTWLRHKHGADFITVTGSTTNHDGRQQTDPFTATRKFADVASWIRQRTDLPLWWAEWRPTDAISPDLAFTNALMATTLLEILNSRASVALLWQPEGDVAGLAFPQGLWTSTRNPGGGQPTLYSATQRIFKEHFAVGTTLFRAESSSPQVRVLASAAKTLLINTGEAPVTVALDGTELVLGRYEVRLLDTR